MYCTVVIESRSSGIGEGLTYECSEDIVPGALVRVPLRKSLTIGIVLETFEKLPEHIGDVKTVAGVVSAVPLLPDSILQCARWLARETFSLPRYALGLWLPTLDWEKLLPSAVTGYSLAQPQPPVRGAKREEVVAFLQNKEWASVNEILDHTSASPAVLKAMAEANILSRSEKRAEFPGPMPDVPVSDPPGLTGDQKKAHEIIDTSAKPTLLFGVTGSGKTEIYEVLVADVVRKNGQAIVLVPEILLTEAIVARFLEVLPRESIAVVHSKLTPGQRQREWLRVRTGQAKLVLGSRSALFAPCRNLKLVVIDEEHEWTYKNERSPRYHARTVAEELCRLSDAKLLLGSATPSVESWQAVKDGRYTLARLPKRYGDAVLPNVRIIDLADSKFGSSYPFTQPLIDAIQLRLDRGEQSVLFLNHRGIASALLCLDCRRRVVSPDSQLPFTVHMGAANRPYLLDHSSGLKADVPDACPHCKSNRLHSIGAGTQRLESLLGKLFPKARVIRADSDTLDSPDKMRQMLTQMKEGRADILVGTQTVALGLDIAGVTLAGVLVADVGLSLPHFRASERVFQLLTQLSGRSGRSKPGEVIIQTFRPDALEVVAAATHDAEKFLEQELKIRSATGYPPFGRLVRLISRGPDASKRARQLHAVFSAKNLNAQSPLKISVAPTFMSGGKEWHLLMRGKDPISILAGVNLSDIAIDVDPLETL